MNEDDEVLSNEGLIPQEPTTEQTFKPSASRLINESESMYSKDYIPPNIGIGNTDDSSDVEKVPNLSDCVEEII